MSITESSSIPSTPTYEKPLIEEKPQKRLKRKDTPEQSAPDPFLQNMQQMDERMMKMVDKDREVEEDEATKFCMSLIPVLKDFDKKKLRLTKVKIQQLLYDIEFGDEYDQINIFCKKV